MKLTKIISVVTIIFLPYLTQAQDIGKAQNYYLNINKAIESILDEEYEEAIKYYDIAFHQTLNPLFTDIVNYLNCVLLSDLNRISSIRKLTYWSNYLVNHKNTQWDYIRSLLIDDPLLALYSDKYLCYKKNILYNQIAYSEILNLFYDDQNIRPGNIEYTKEIKLAIENKDTLNWVKFNKFIEIYGFPNEDYLPYSKNGKDTWSIVSTLLRHFVQRGFGEDVIELAKIEFYNLRMPRNLYVNLMELEFELSTRVKKKYQMASTYVTMIDGTMYKSFIDYSDHNIELINNNRSKLFLPKLDVSFNNFVCVLKCSKGNVKKFFIEPYTSIEELPGFLFESEKDQEMLSEYRIDNVFDFGTCPCTEY